MVEHAGAVHRLSSSPYLESIQTKVSPRGALYRYPMTGSGSLYGLREGLQVEAQSQVVILDRSEVQIP